MKPIACAAVFALLSTLNLQLFTACAQGTAFTYQGQLQSNGTPANGRYNLTFTMFTASLSGTVIAGPVTNNAVGVTNGLFTTLVDFGNSFSGTSNWLEIAVVTNGSTSFITLSPRQQLTPVPYALVAAGLPGLTVQNNTNGAPNLIGGASNNFVSPGIIGATIAGGGAVNDSGYSIPNSVSADYATVSGGSDNTASSYGAAVGGGNENSAGGYYGTVGGGRFNITSGNGATVGGGGGNTASGESATVVGGNENTASGEFATVAAGNENTASGAYSFAAGQQAQALHDGAFVWSDDSSSSTYFSDRNDEFKIRAAGGMQMDVSGSSGLNPAAVTINSTSGNGIGLLINQNSSDTSALFANGGAGDIIKGFSGNGNTVFEVVNNGTVYSKGFALSSDRNAKENFAPLDAGTILEKVASLPVTKWNYKTDGKDVTHLGPMAQDFHSAFGLNGVDDQHISVVDEGGVALAAIQGLNQKLEEQQAENRQLKQRLDRLEKILQQKLK